jgi:hypothetical protein
MSRPPRFDYHEYLASREWAALRERVRERSGNRCERCFNAPQHAVHHLTYERAGHEELTDLMAICNPCHEFLSARSDRDPRITYCSLCEAGEVEDAGEEWCPSCIDFVVIQPWTKQLLEEQLAMEKKR